MPGGVQDTVAVSLVGQTENGTGKVVNTSPEGHLEVEVHGPNSAFGEVLTAENNQVVAADFIYTLNTEIITAVEQGSGTVTNGNGLAVCTTAAGASSLASLRTKRVLKYRDGIGAEGRFTAMWNAAAATDPVGATTTAGFGTAESGLFFGYVGTGGAYGFCAIHNESNTREVQKLQITTKSSNSQTAVVTLGSVAYNVNVTNGANVQQTAWEIATGVNYTATFPGWTASALGDTVYFIASNAGDVSGTFSVSFPTSGAGTFTEVTAGALGTTNIIPQSSWNIDVCDGSNSASNPSGMNLDPTKLNVFFVRYQYLGAGEIMFGLETPETGELVPVHRVKRANGSTTPSLKNPGFPFQMSARNTSNTSAVAVSCGSVGAFIQGKINRLGVQRAYTGTASSIGTTITPLFSIKASLLFNNKVSTAQIAPLVFALTNLTSAKAAIVEVYENPTLTPYANFSSVNSSTSVAQIGTTATGLDDGVLKTGGVAPGGGIVKLDLEKLAMVIDPGSYITFACKANSTTVDVAYSLSWAEDQ